MDVTSEHPDGPVRLTGTDMVSKGFWAVLDQGLFAVANYVVASLPLAWWLSQTDYGAFSTAFAAFLLFGVFHTSVLTEPMLVLAPGRYRDDVPRYLGALVRGHVVISLFGSLLLAISGLVCRFYGAHVLSTAFFCFAINGPFILFLWLMRRACYARMNPRRAALSGIGYLVMMVGGLVAVHKFGTLSISSALLLMGASSLVIGVWLAVSERTVQFTNIGERMMRDVAIEHWHYGKWATPTALLGFLPQNFFYFLIPLVGTLAQTGALRALSNLYLPIGQANSALCLLLLPVFVRTRGTREGKRMHHLALLVLAGGPIIYWLILGLFHKEVIGLVYKHKYDEFGPLMWVLGLQQVANAFCGVYGAVLRAHQKLNAVFWAGVVAAITAVGLGLVMTRWSVLAGACWSVVLSYGAHHLCLWLFSRRIFGDQTNLPSMHADQNGNGESAPALTPQARTGGEEGRPMVEPVTL